MESKASIRKHPVHPMLVAFPIGLWTFAFVCDIVYAVSPGRIWQDMALYTLLGGVLTALLAAIPGFIDYLAITDRNVKRVATIHMVLNLLAVAIFIFNLGLRLNPPARAGIQPIVISAIGIAFIVVSGWFGGTLVYKHRVGVIETPTSAERRDHAA
jgi:uncharacterized membrane protein